MEAITVEIVTRRTCPRSTRVVVFVRFTCGQCCVEVPADVVLSCPHVVAGILRRRFGADVDTASAIATATEALEVMRP